MNFSFIIGIIASLGGLLVFVKYILLIEIRLDGSLSKDMIEFIKKNNNFITVNEELLVKDGTPSIFSCLTLIKGIPVFYYRGERLLTAGWRSVDTISYIVTFRFFGRKIRKNLKEYLKINETVDVNIIGAYGYNKIGKLDITMQSPLFLDLKTYEDIDSDFKLLIGGKIKKTSLLLYGDPGNGKTNLIRHLSIKYGMDVAIITFSADYTNEYLQLLFSEIPTNTMVLLEDFDSVFDGRKCLIASENIKFTFDGLLNALDGIWSSDKKLVYCLTCNDLNKVDDAIKNRRSRVKFIREIKPPSYEIREKILNNKWLAKTTEGLSLDKTFYVKHQLEAGFGIKYIMQNINK